MYSHKTLDDITEEDPSELSLDSAENKGPKCGAANYTTLLIAVIADEDTCVGYLLGGIGEIDDEGGANYFIVNSKTRDVDIERAFIDFVNRKDVGLVLITKEAAEKIHPLVHNYNGAVPVVIQIPGKNGPYEINIDNILNIANSREKEKSEQQRLSLAERRTSHQERKSIGEERHYCEETKSTGSVKSSSQASIDL